MSDDTKALVAELRGSVRDATPLGHRQLIWQAADTIERLQRDRDAIAERCEKLREALRRARVVQRGDVGDLPADNWCSECYSRWELDAPERHAEGCLAA